MDNRLRPRKIRTSEHDSYIYYYGREYKSQSQEKSIDVKPVKVEQIKMEMETSNTLLSSSSMVYESELIGTGKSQVSNSNENILNKRAASIVTEKRRRNSSSSESSQSSYSSRASSLSQNTDDLYIDIANVDRSPSGTTRKKMHIRDEIDLALALGISVEELTPEKIKLRKSLIKEKLTNHGAVSLNVYEEFDIHVRGEHFANNMEPDDKFYVTQGKPIIEKLQEECAMAKRSKAGLNGKGSCATKSCIFQHGKTSEKGRKKKNAKPVACHVIKPVPGNECNFEESLVLPQGTCLLRPVNKLVELVAQSINDSPDGLLQVQQVYLAIQNRYPYFKYMDKSSLTSWRSSIRHALYQKWFKKVQFKTDLINVRGCYWALNWKNQPREWNLPQRKHEDFCFDPVDDNEFIGADFVKNSPINIEPYPTVLHYLGDFDMHGDEIGSNIMYKDTDSDEEAINIDSIEPTITSVTWNCNPDPMMPQQFNTNNSQEIHVAEEKDAYSEVESSSDFVDLFKDRNDLVVSIPGNGTTDSSEYYPVAASDLLEDRNNLQPVVLTPFVLMPNFASDETQNDIMF